MAEAGQLDETSSAIKSQESLLEAVECGSDGDQGQTEDGMSIPLLQLIQQLLRYSNILVLRASLAGCRSVLLACSVSSRVAGIAVYLIRP